MAIGNTTKSFTVDSKKVKEVSKNVATKVALEPVKAGWWSVKNNLKATGRLLLGVPIILVPIGCGDFYCYKKFNKIEGLKNTDTLDVSKKFELFKYINTLLRDKQQWKTLYILLKYLSDGRHKEAYNDFIGIGEKIEVDLSYKLLDQLEKKLKNINSHYSIENSKELFEWVHQNIIKSEDIINGNGDLPKIAIENFSGDKDRIKKLVKAIAILSNKLSGTNDKNLHALLGEFNAIKKRIWYVKKD